MAAKVTNYQCPACTGPLHFAGGSGKLECDYCGSSYDVEEIEALYADREAEAAAAAAEAEQTPEGGWDAAAAGCAWGEEGKAMRAYSCPSCGAQLICDQTTAASSCPYCGNPSVIPGRFSAELRPDHVLPFRLSKEDAVAALKKHYHGKLLLPRVFSDQNHIQEIKGIYVPFWLFDGEAEVDMTFHATNSETHREGDYRVTSTTHYDVARSGTIGFSKVPVDGSSKMPDDLMDSIEPYDYADLKEFSTAYLPGFLADVYDVDAKQACKRADERCRNTAVAETRETVRGYMSVHTRSQQVRLHQGQVHYALLPVWVLSTKWRGETYLFAMNGQTGKMVGDLPADPVKARAWFFGTLAGASLVLSLLFSGPLGRFFGNLLF